MKTLLRAALMGSVISFAGLGLASAQTIPAPGQILVAADQTPLMSLSAYGEVKVAPDMASISTGVVTEASTAAEAMRLNREKMVQVIAALKRQGIAEKDIQTSGLNLSAQYTYRENQPPELRGYQASNQVTVVVYDLTRVGAAVDAVVASGANQVNGISFGLRDPQAAEDAARLEAVRRLQAKARLYAQALGKPVVAIRSFTEGGGYSPPPPMPMYRMAAQAEAADASTPIAAGQLTLRVDVQGVYELAR
ncbi:MAG: SIMPL domain-containing protein [Caulobacteraceae bacterium]|nr:SIMPL domain-containing protein [Caulobacteraceae bacterium]